MTIYNWEEKCEKLKESVGTIMRDDIHEIEQLTVQQNDSEYWHKACFGRITASKCHEVMTRMKTLDKDETQTSENIVKQFLSPKNICTKAMETGGKWEKDCFPQIQDLYERKTLWLESYFMWNVC